MKIINHWKPILFIAIALMAALFLWRKLIEINKTLEDSCTDRGYGNTKIKLKVLDINSKKTIDSIRLVIKYGPSADKLIDTVLKQKDYIEYSFDIPEINECEGYWFELSHRLYWDEVAYTNQSTGILNGKLNESLIYLTPATKVKAQLINKLKDNNADTFFLYFDRKGEDEYGIWNYYTSENFKNSNTTSSYFHLESGRDYTASWIRKNNTSSDTTTFDFHTLPFDTIPLKFELK